METLNTEVMSIYNKPM